MRSNKNIQAAKSNLKTRKIVLFGCEQSGKTSLLNRLVHGEYSDNTESTVGAGYFVKRMAINDIELRMQYFDTAGAARFKSIIKSYYRGADYCVGVIDLTNPASLVDVSERINDIRKMNPRQDIQLIGTKLDLKDQRKVTDNMINDLKERYNIRSHYLVSAKIPEIGNDISTVFRSYANVCIPA